MKTNLQATIRWYDDHAGEYAAKIESKVNLSEIEQFAGYLSKGSIVLDAGCAAGRDSKVLKGLGLSVIGVDLSGELLKIARRNNPDIKFVQADLLDLPFEDEEFGGIWASGSLVHLGTKKQIEVALLEFWRILGKGGIVYSSALKAIQDVSP